MKKMCLIAVMLLFWAQSVKGQFLEIQLTNGPALCCGYGKDNLACVTITQLPAKAPENTILVYSWYARHQKGLKTWNTTFSTRWIPLPWPGTYEVWAVIYYVDPRTRGAFAAFRSNAILLNAHHCESPRSTDGQTKG